MKNKPYRYYLYLALRFGIWVMGLLPRRPALAFAKFLGALSFYLVSRQRSKVLSNLEKAFGKEKSTAEIKALGRQVFENLAMTLTDLVFLKRITKENMSDYLDLNGLFSRCDELLKEGKGLIVASGHIGNWELMGSIFGIQGYHGGVIGKRIYYDKYNELIVNARQAKGVPTFYQDENPREIVRELKRGGVIGLVADQDVERLEGVFVDYFGMASYTPTAPIKLAQLSGAPMLVGALVRTGYRYEIVFSPEPIRVPRDADEMMIQRLTEQWSKALEGIIRQYPDQWVWMHDRWKTKKDSQKEMPSLCQGMLTSSARGNLKEVLRAC